MQEARSDRRIHTQFELIQGNGYSSMNTLNNHNGAVGNGRADHATGRGTPQPPMAQFARVRNYWLGGKDNSAIDQAVGNEIARILPSIHAQARAGQLFLNRVVRHLAAEHHIRQFMDIGIVFPVGDSTHEVAQRVAPDCKIVYVDHDAVLLAHARALLTSHPDGTCGYVDADLCEPDKILAAAGQSLDLDEPVALLLAGVLHHLPDDGGAASVVARLVDALAPGSFVGISHLTNVVHGAASDKAWQYWNERGTPQVVLRSPEQLAGFLHGLDLTKPGVVSCSRWRPEAIPWGPPAEVDKACRARRHGRVLLGRKT